VHNIVIFHVKIKNKNKKEVSLMVEEAAKNSPQSVI